MTELETLIDKYQAPQNKVMNHKALSEKPSTATSEKKKR